MNITLIAQSNINGPAKKEKNNNNESARLKRQDISYTYFNLDHQLLNILAPCLRIYSRHASRKYKEMKR